MYNDGMAIIPFKVAEFIHNNSEVTLELYEMLDDGRAEALMFPEDVLAEANVYGIEVPVRVYPEDGI